jgi:FkbM family methyltransferase
VTPDNYSVCVCSGPGHCPRFGRLMTGRLFEICHGDALTADKQRVYRVNWAAQAAQQGHTSSYDCEYRGAVIDKAQCQTCDRQNITVPVFACPLHGRTILAATNDEQALDFAQAVQRGESPEVWQCNLCRDPFHVTPETPTDQLLPLFQRGWTKPGASHWPNVVAAFREAFTAAIERIPTAPEFAHERGIAICGGSKKYFPSAYVAIRIIRHLGCDWPIELWHLGPNEKEPAMVEMTAPLGVTWRDGREIAAQHALRCAGGWPLKAIALAYSDFAETTLIDADCYPVHHPAELLDQGPYCEHGAVFFADSSDLTPELYDWFGVPRHPQNLALESGQMVVDKRRHWRAAWLAVWLNHNSEWVYKHVYGDKDTFLLAWLKAGHSFAMPARRPDRRLPGAFVHPDFAGRDAFVHRIHAKFAFESWGRQWFQSGQREIKDSAFPHAAWCAAAVDAGNQYLAPRLVNEPWLERTIPRGGRLALDIGANRGLWANVLSRRYDRVLAFEPQPAMHPYLQFRPGIELVPVALWDSAGQGAEQLAHNDPSRQSTRITLWHDDDPGHTTAFEPHPGHPMRVAGSFDVPAITLDSLELADVDFVKIDTEGAEARILRGGMATIKRWRPKLVIEYHSAELLTECQGLLGTLDYRFEVIPDPYFGGDQHGWLVATHAPPEPLACVHRGEVVRTAVCEPCGGVLVKVQACDLHCECTLSTKDFGVTRCANCPDRSR